MKFFSLANICLPLLFLASSAEAQPGSAELTESLRQDLEDQFRSSTGLGFAEFQCNLPEDEPPGREITCHAIDEEGDHFDYRIISKAQDQPPSVTTTQPIGQLNPAGRTLLERPCLAFLSAFGRNAWSEVYDGLSSKFRDDISLAEFETLIEPIRQALGKVQAINAMTYASPSPGFHLLEYALQTDGGDAVARFRLQFVSEEEVQILAFLVSAKPGSTLQARLLSDAGRQTLVPLLGQPVDQVIAPLDQLELIGEFVEGKAVLDDGAEVRIRVEQHSTAHDLDGNDYRFQVLEVAWLIRRYLVSTGTTPRDVACPAPTAPDGGQIECTATLDDGSKRTITIARRGGDHRLMN